MEKIITRFLSFLVVLGVIFVFFHMDVVKKPDLVLSCDPNNIESLILKTDEDVLEVRRAPEKWYWTLHGKYLSAHADNQTVESIGKSYCNLPFLEKYTLPDGSQKALSAYGLSDPALTFGIKLDAKEIWISIGNESVSGAEFYLASSDQSQAVFLVSDQYRFLKDVHFLDMRSKAMFDMPKVKHVLLNFQGETIALDQQSSDLWVSNHPSMDEDSIKKIIDLLGTIAYANYKKVSNEQTLNEYGFFLPDITIEVEDENGIKKEYLVVRSRNVFQLKFLYGQHPYILMLHTEPMMELSKLLENLVFNNGVGG